jgi:hypothetical protein
VGGARVIYKLGKASANAFHRGGLAEQVAHFQVTGWKSAASTVSGTRTRTSITPGCAGEL